jgi:hypothetical protein
VTPPAVPFAAALRELIPPDAREVGNSAVEGGQIVPDVVDGLISGLVEDLAVAVAPTLLADFGSAPARASISPVSTSEHDAFLASLLAGRLECLLASLPALADLLNVIRFAWSRTSSQCLARLRDDESVLVERFAVELPFVEAERLVGGSVALTDSRGRRIVYKHRGVSMDVALAWTLGWLNDQGPAYEFAVADIVDRVTHGWMSYVPHEPPMSKADRSAYLHRTGGLLALATALGSADLHLANVRASGAHPMILDAELLLRPRRAGESADLPAVLTSGWLPFPGFVEGSGLACELPGARPSRWQFVGTDAVRHRPRRPADLELRRALERQLTHDAPYLPHIGHGYADVCRALMRRALPLEIFEETRPRVVLRPSRRYDDAMARSVQPAALASRALRSESVETLVCEPPPSVADHPTVANAVRCIERDSVLALHYPRFGARAGQRSLWWEDQELGMPFRKSPLDRARARLAAMDEQRLQLDLATIESSLAAVVAEAADGSGSSGV